MATVTLGRILLLLLSGFLLYLKRWCDFSEISWKVFFIVRDCLSNKEGITRYVFCHAQQSRRACV